MEFRMKFAARYTLVLLLGVFVGAGITFDMTVMAEREQSKSAATTLPIDELRTFTEIYARIKAGRGWLGVHLEPMSPELARQTGLTEPAGAQPAAAGTAPPRTRRQPRSQRRAPSTRARRARACDLRRPQRQSTNAAA